MESLKIVLSTVVVLLIVGGATVVQACLPSEREALLEFRSKLNEPNFGLFDTWKGQDCCKGWYGVTCDPNKQRVSRISLNSVSDDPIFGGISWNRIMTGSISPAICKLTHLSSLTISNWRRISGVIPSCITNLLFLTRLNLSGNRILGVIPENISKLKRLYVLMLADNEISGRIPASITRLTALGLIDLGYNNISGVIPRDIGRLKMLARLQLSNNKISGQIPESLTQVNTLVVLELSMNRITGSISASFGELPLLAVLKLDGNLISGVIPGTVMSSLIIKLNLRGNYLSGRIPDTFGPRAYFSVLDLSNNRLEGPIPTSIEKALYIGEINLSYNKLCGKIPKIPRVSPDDRLEATSFAHNSCLCGAPLKNWSLMAGSNTIWTSCVAQWEILCPHFAVKAYYPSRLESHQDKYEYTLFDVS